MPDSGGSDIVNKATGKLKWLREGNVNFMLDVRVPPPTAVDPYVLGNNYMPFQRQP